MILLVISKINHSFKTIRFRIHSESDVKSKLLSDAEFIDGYEYKSYCRTLLLPLIDGSSAKSAATADVIMLFGPPTRHPMNARRRRRMVTGMSFMYSAKM